MEEGDNRPRVAILPPFQDKTPLVRRGVDDAGGGDRCTQDAGLSTDLGIHNGDGSRAGFDDSLRCVPRQAGLPRPPISQIGQSIRPSVPLVARTVGTSNQSLRIGQRDVDIRFRATSLLCGSTIDLSSDIIGGPRALTTAYGWEHGYRGVAIDHCAVRPTVICSRTVCNLDPEARITTLC